MSSSSAGYGGPEELLQLDVEALKCLLKQYDIAPGNVKNNTVRKLKVKKLWAAIQEKKEAKEESSPTVEGVSADEPINLDLSGLSINDNTSAGNTVSTDTVPLKDEDIQTGRHTKQALLDMNKANFVKVLEQYSIAVKGNVMQSFIRKKLVEQILKKWNNISLTAPLPSGSSTTPENDANLAFSATPPEQSQLPESPPESPGRHLDKSSEQFFAVRPGKTKLSPGTPQLETYVFNRIADALERLKSLKDKTATLSAKKTKYEEAVNFLTLPDNDVRVPHSGPRVGREPQLNDSPKMGEKDFLVIKLLIERRVKDMPIEDVLQKIEDYLRENPNRIMTKESFHPVILSPNFRWNAIHYATTKNFMQVIQLYHKLLTETDDFVFNLFKYQTPQKRQRDIATLYEAYFNTPDRVALDTPLHLAAKYALPDVLRFLLHTAIVDVEKRDKFGKLASDVVGSRLRESLTAEQIRNREQCTALFDSLYILDLDTDRSKIVRYTTLDKPSSFIGPSSKPVLFNIQLQLERKWTLTSRPDCPNTSLSSIPVHLGVRERNNLTLSDYEKGRSAYVRLLCRREDLAYHEHWPFLQASVDWTGDLEPMLYRVESAFEQKRDETVSVNGMDDLLDNTMDQLCFQFDNFHFSDEFAPSVSTSGISMATSSGERPPAKLYLEGSQPSKADTQFFDAINQYFSNDTDDIKEALEKFPETFAWYDHIANSYSQSSQRASLKTPIRSKNQRHSTR